MKITEGVQVAQAATPPGPAAGEEKPEEKKVERVVVTGSRLKKSEFTSSAPVQIITSEETTLEGLHDTAEILQGSTIAAGSQQINNTFGGFVTDGGPGANTVGLRGLDPKRTLILINGRRLAPAGSRGALGSPDLNTIPNSMIDRIEVLKDGGSAVYGSDAVAGVVNVITRRNYDGASLDGFVNMSEDGGGEIYQLDGRYGATFERGQFMIAGEYYRRDALRVGDRDYLSCNQDSAIETGLNFTSDVGVGGLLDIIDPRTGQSKCFNQLEGVIDRIPTLFISNAAGTAALSNAAQTVAQRIALAEQLFLQGGRFAPAATSAGGGAFGLDLNGLQRVGLSYVQVAHRLFPGLVPLINNSGSGFTASQAFAALGTAANRSAVEAAWRASQAAVPNDDPRFLSTTIISPVTRYSFFAQGSYDLFPGVEAYGEAQFTRRESEQERWRQLFPNVCGRGTLLPVPLNVSQGAQGFGIFPPLGSAALCTATNSQNTLGVLSRSIIEVPTNSEQTVDYYRAVVGIRGDLGAHTPIFHDWSYDLWVQRQRSESDYTNDIIYNDRVNAATGPDGCNPALITISGPVPICTAAFQVNWFRPSTVSDGVFTQQESDFLFTKETGHTTYSQTIVNGAVTGDVFQLPAGTMSAAVGFEARWDEIDDTPGFNARNNNLWGQTSAGRTAGSDTVYEVFGETNIPLLAGWRFAENMNLDASWRYTNYDSFGEDTTYKLGLNWQITPEYRLRGTTGTSFRAPALFEMFLANQTGFLGQANIDPCVNWVTSTNPFIVASCGPGGLNLPATFVGGAGGSALILTGGGGPGVLSAERSESRTVGFIWTPDWMDFSAALDYWELEVTNEVGTFGALNIVTACHTVVPFGSSPFCTLFNRDTDPTSPTFGRINTVNNSFVNISSEVTDGLDLTVRAAHEFSWGTFTLDVAGNWFFTREQRIFPNSATITEFNGEVYFPDFVGEVNLRYDYEDWTFNWNVDMSSRESNDEEFGGNVFIFRASPFAGAFKQYGEFYASHDASLRYRADDWAIQVGVQNLFDDPPPTVGAGGAFGKVGNTIAVGNPVYDLIGRRGFITISKEF